MEKIALNQKPENPKKKQKKSPKKHKNDNWTRPMP
jgi:hypothetical protein